MSAYDMHPSLHMKWLVVLPIWQVVPLDCHEFHPRLCKSSRRAKHSYMLHKTLCQVMMLSQQPLALSSSTWNVVPTNISALTLLVCIKVVNRSYGLHNQLDLLSKISTLKLRKWGTNCLGQISYFLFYPSSAIVGNLPRHFMTKVHRHGPSRGFNMTTHS